MLIMVMTAGMMTSCDEVVFHAGYGTNGEVAFRLEGEWRGDFGMNYTTYFNGRPYTFDSYDTYLVFYPNNGYASGWGKQVDYYEYGPYEYQYYKFNWTVRNGILYLTYPYDPELNVRIYDYKISYNHFMGRFENSSAGFDLIKLSSPYNWGYYNGNYMYGAYDEWVWGNYPYYAKSRAAATTNATDSVSAVKTDTNEPLIVKPGNRYMNNLNKEKAEEE